MADRPFMKNPYASAFAMMEVLLQHQDQKYRKKCATIRYWSRAVAPVDNNYSTTWREFLSVVWELKALRTYVEGTLFKFLSDDYTLKWMIYVYYRHGRLYHCGSFIVLLSMDISTVDL